MTDLDSHAIWPSLSREVDSTFSLLRAADSSIGRLRHLSQDTDPLLAVLSLGVERLLKLVHGLNTADTAGSWPSHKEMSTTYSHAITHLDQVCRQHVTNGLTRATSPTYIRSLLVAVEDCPLLDRLLATLTSYAKGGRFHNLDILAEKPPQVHSPEQLWEVMERHILDVQPELFTLLGQPGGYDQARAAINSEVQKALRDWWTLYVRAAMHGCFGPRAKRWLSAGMPPPTGPG